MNKCISSKIELNDEIYNSNHSTLDIYEKKNEDRNNDMIKDNTNSTYDKEYIEKIKRLKKQKYFGNKTIGKFSSYIYLINQIFGSGIVSIPYVFKNSGWLPSLFANILICILTIFNSLLFLRTMTMIPNNIHFNKRYEYISTVCYFLGKKNIYFWLVQICFYASILCSNIISIVIVSLAVDHLIINMFGYTIGFVIYPNIEIKYFTNINELYYTKNYILCVTIGYIINAIVSIYFSQSNLEDNMKVQFLSFFFLMTTILQMIYLSILKIYQYNTTDINLHILRNNYTINKYTDIKYPTIFGNYNFKQLISSYISSYSTVTVIPCWANEMKSDVKVIKTVWLCNLFCCIIYYIFGYVLCTAYPNINNDNILNDILQTPFLNIYMKISIYIFDILTIAPGIYVYCIATRYNLINSNICSEKTAFLFGTIFPFFISCFFNSRYIFENIFTWSSLIFSYACNFITPSIIYLIACKNIPFSEKNPLKYIHVLYDPKEYMNRKSLSQQIQKGNNNVCIDKDIKKNENASISTMYEGKYNNKHEYNNNNFLSINKINDSKAEQIKYVNSESNHFTVPIKTNSKSREQNNMENKKSDISIQNQTFQQKKKKSVSLKTDNVFIRINTEDMKEEELIEYENDHQEKYDNEKNKEHTYNDKMNHTHYEKDKINITDDNNVGNVKNIKKTKQKKDMFEYRKYNSLFNTKKKNVSYNSPKKNESNSYDIRRSRKHKTVMGFEKKKRRNKHEMNIIHDGYNKYQNSDSHSDEDNNNNNDDDEDILHDKIIADLSRDIYNDIKIIQNNYERDEYLIKCSDIFDSFLNLKLMMETEKNNNTNMESIYNVANNYNINSYHNINYMNNIKDQYNTVVEYSNISNMPISNISHINHKPEMKPSSFFSYPCYKSIDHSNNFYINNAYDINYNNMNIQEKNKLLDIDNENDKNLLLYSDVKDEEKEYILFDKRTISENTIQHEKEVYNENNKLCIQQTNNRIGTPNNNYSDKKYIEKKKNQLNELINNQNKYKHQFNNIEKEFDILISGINNKQNLTWAFDGNKKENDIQNKKNFFFVNNKNINVSNVICSFNLNNTLNNTYRKSTSFGYFYNSKCKKYVEGGNVINKLYKILNRMNTYGSSPLNCISDEATIPSQRYRKQNTDIYYYINDKERNKKGEHMYNNILSYNMEDEPCNMLLSNSTDKKEDKGKISTISNDNKKIINNNNNNKKYDNNFHKDYHVGFDNHIKNNQKEDENNHEEIKNVKSNYHNNNLEQKSSVQSQDKLLYSLNSYNKRSKVYKDINTLSVPDNVYNVIPQLNKRKGTNSYDEDINNLYNYYKYNFLLCFNENIKNNKTFIKNYNHIRNTNIYYNNSIYNNKESTMKKKYINKNDKLKIDINITSQNDIMKKNKNFKSLYINTFSNDEKKEPLINHNKNDIEELPTIKLICSEKPIYGYEDAYQIDDYVNGQINENIIHVYPFIYLRIKHVKITQILLGITIMLLFIAIIYDFIY
ncbi:amino acid transporter, putative [Plasmodium sp. gorilla clade G2]|uniref:amino acid transporter, putative n=1 Tax=Plasmodium sp. gorilla clade G2 TaxID=880535 RepID=UPI000D20DA2B|nr:amino acid transporter, putative [Plasmodium sp. gorilla clade G2]SOV16588.1 amino acid transporter, putative [Plasmodium sp. gorilla clade G2]